MVESPLYLNPSYKRLSLGGSSNIRRSISHALITNCREKSNDDDGERLSLLASELSVPTSTPKPTRETMSSSSQKEHFQGCLKLYTENKITKENAWSLQLLDFMRNMMRRHDRRMDDLQTASTLIDASTRIYSVRVDAVHYDVLKIAGGICKAVQSKRGKKDDDNMQDDGAVDDDAGGIAPTKKKKKRSKGAIAPNPDVFNGDFDANDYIDPFFEMLAATTGDVTSSNRAFNVTLPVHDVTFALILRTDDQFLQPVPENLQEDLILSDNIILPAKLLSAFRDTDQICEPFAGFSITDWDPLTENTEGRINNWVEETRLNLSQQALVFDVNAEVEPIPEDEAHNDLFDDEPLGGVESEEEADVAVAACVARAANCMPVGGLLGAGGCATAGGVARLTDMRPNEPTDTRLEYSYSSAIVSAWAGPTHWRLKNNRSSKLSERTQSTGGRVALEGRKPTRTKRLLDFTVTGIAFDCRGELTGDYEPTQSAKIMISRKTLATGHTWNEANFKTPINRGLDESHFRKLFLRRKVMMYRKRDVMENKQPELPTITVEEVREYNYDNENDASYCPLPNIQDTDVWGNEDATAARDLHDQVKISEPDDIGEMLEPPTKIAKIFIPYAMRAKKVDMKQLKNCTWKILTGNTPHSEKEKVTPTSFFDIYSRLPNKLSSNMKESLSVPLALLSVLHLANEMGLVIQNQDDLKDFNILGLIK